MFKYGFNVEELYYSKFGRRIKDTRFEIRFNLLEIKIFPEPNTLF